MHDEKSPLSSAVLLADISKGIIEVKEMIGHVASSTAQSAIYTAKAVRILDGQHALSSSDRRSLERVAETQRALTAQLAKAVDGFNPRPPSLTVVADVPHDREDTTGVFIRLPGMKERKKVPTKVLVPMMLVIGAVVHWFGAQFPEIWKWATSP